LVAGGLVTAEQVEQALRAQVMWGGRLGTNLIELGFIDLDQLSRTLGILHKLPSALGRHFEKIDKDLQKLLSPDVAEKFSVVPLLRVAADDKVIVAGIGPLETRPLAIIADDMGLGPAQIVVTVAAELRIRYQLERAYNIPRSSRFLRSRGPAFPQFTTAPDVGETSDVDLPAFASEEPSARRTGPEFGIEEPSARRRGVVEGRRPPQITPPPIPSMPPRPATIDDLGVPILDIEPDPEPEPTEAELKARRTYVRTLSETNLAAVVPAEPIPEPPPPPPEHHEAQETPETEESKRLGRIALRRIAAPPALVGETSRHALGGTLGEATRSIRRATDRDRVVDLMIQTVAKFAPGCEAALVLVVRGDAAISWRSFSRRGYAIPEIAVPLDQSPLAQKVVETRTATRLVCDELDAIDTLLFRALGGGEDGELVVIPVVIADQVMCLVAMVGTESSEVEAIAGAAGAGFARLMRDASR
jgi:hypothetical protein